MTGCIALRKDIYYVRLTYYDKNHKRKDKWVSTGLSGRGANQKATAMIQSLIEKYSYLEKSDHPSKMAEYFLIWKNLRKNEVAETTFDGYHTHRQTLIYQHSTATLMTPSRLFSNSSYASSILESG